MSDALKEARIKIEKIRPGKPLPSAMMGDRSNLSPRARYEISQMMKPDPKGFLTQAAMAWAVIAASIALAHTFHHGMVYLLAIILIATRQNILGLLVHEQSHFLAFKSKWGELLANILTAYPLLIAVDSYAQVHLAHHAYYFTEMDPDYLRKQGDDWIFPMPGKHLVKMALMDLTGANTLETLKGKRTAMNFTAPRKIATPVWVRPLFYAVASVVFTVTHSWQAFFLFWMVPLLSILQVIIRWGAICEHKYNLRQPGLEKSTPLIVLRWWEKLLLPNLNFTLHIYHHYYPGIPFSKLPKVHSIFQRERLVNELNVFRGYGQYLQFLLRTECWNPFRKNLNER